MEKEKKRIYKLLQKEDTDIKGNRKNNSVYEGVAVQSLGHVPNSFWPHELPGSSVHYVYEEMITNVIENILN